MSRQRLDTLLTERGLAPSRTAAATSIRAGMVRIGRGGERAARPSQMVPEDTRIELEEGRRFVSRGGHKLEAALDAFAIDVAGRRCLDVGASTGGFTDLLLQRGAASVVALDVGHGQLDWSLREDDRVIVLEGRNARELESADLPFAPELATIDVSFISLAKVLGPVSSCLAGGGEILAMVKPQFELRRARVGRGGVVRSAEDREDAIRSVVDASGELGLGATGVVPAGLPGPKGNQEYFVRLIPGAGLDAGEADVAIGAAVR